tara:strand:+ start:2118 stop:2876 length:759 start_codon:yes stop_codon:yes gene_type:complete
MKKIMNDSMADLNLKRFMSNGFDLKSHLADFLRISVLEVESRLPNSSNDLAALHPGALNPEDVTAFYENDVGIAHLIELAGWHLSSRNYIADTLRVQEMFAYGQVLDFGGGIGTHALAAASLKNVDHVWFVDLNPNNRNFVQKRSVILGLESKISVHRDLESTGNIKFDTLTCLDVLEHLADPANQLLEFLKRLSPGSTSLLNWYFFKGFKKEYPFHFDDPKIIRKFFETLQGNFIEIFHPYLITARTYKLL